MKTFDCYVCQEEKTEYNPLKWGIFEDELCCANCVDNYNGPGDDYYEGFAERVHLQQMREERELRNAGRI
jgi:hypothetical protein